MKHLSLLLTTLLCATMATAQGPDRAKAFTRLAPAQADAHGIISERPDGTSRYYTRTGGSTYAPLYFQKVTQDGIMSEVVFSADGTKAYFKNIISHAATDTWVEGNVDGNTISVPLGQMVYWWDSDNYGMRLARVDVKGSIENYTVTSTGSVTFEIGDNGVLSLLGTSGEPDVNIFNGLGLVYTNEYEGKWSYYLDYATVMTPKEVEAVVPPADLEVETYSLLSESDGHIVNVGFDGADVYIQGISRNNVPEAWMKGTITGNKIVFPLQFAGAIQSYLLYFCGTDARIETDEDGYQTWKYYWSDGSITFDFDQRTRSFSSTQTLWVNNSDTGLGRGEAFRSPLFRPYKEVAATPATPSVVAFIDTYFERAGFNIVMFNVPLSDVDGNFIDPDLLSYQIYVDDDEPYPLYADEYPTLNEDMEEIPFRFNDGNRYILEGAYAIYLFQSGFDRIGVQSIYRGGGEERRSDISYYSLTAVNGLPADVPATAMRFDLSGRRVSARHKGVTISRMSDGSIRKHILH